MASDRPEDEAEWRTRKKRIDPRLDARGWPRRKGGVSSKPFRTEEEETENGPADYALWVGDAITGIVEAKRLTVGPQGALVQAERYARGLPNSSFNFRGLRAPFLYSTNGATIRFHDVRDALNVSREVADFHTPDALLELLGRDFAGACTGLTALPNENNRLRDYQREANAAVEEAIRERKRHMLVAMATGTGKTYTLVNQVYRLMKSGVGRRVLFLVDRRALAAQAVRAFASYEVEPGKKFDKVYEVYSSRFHKDDFDDDENFDPKVLQSSALTDPKPGAAFVYVCTIQRMAINLLGRGAFRGPEDEEIDEDADRLDIPIHAFDVIIADECHRGYTSQELSAWRDTLKHFDAIKIGLTATPAAHTTSFFEHLVYRYDYQQAVRDGHLVDYDVVSVHSDVRMKGVFLREGDEVDKVDTKTGATQLELLEDERAFDAEEVERKVTAPDSNRKIVEELRKHALEHETRYGRFPKTLIFAANDVPHVSHADQLVTACRDAFGRGEEFVEKITGKADRPLQMIRKFRNRPNPGVAVTVDLLSTGVDIPDLEFIVFLRPVKSRILFEQMLGRGTRKGERFPDKSHFVVFDCFDGTLLEYFRKATGITAEMPEPPARPIAEVIEEIWQNKDRDYNIGCLVKRLHRIDKQMSGEARKEFEAFIPDGDVASYARGLRAELRTDFAGAMKRLRDRRFQRLLVDYPRPTRIFLKAIGVADQVSSKRIFRDEEGAEVKPEDYLAAFARFVKNNPLQIEGIRILLNRPRDWSATALTDLRRKLAQRGGGFTEESLQQAHEVCHGRALVDIISMVKYAADDGQPLLRAEERVDRALTKIRQAVPLTSDQEKWIEMIKVHLVTNLSIDREDFDVVPVLSREGGWAAARRVFGDGLDALLKQLNEAIAA